MACCAPSKTPEPTTIEEADAAVTVPQEFATPHRRIGEAEYVYGKDNARDEKALRALIKGKNGHLFAQDEEPLWHVTKIYPNSEPEAPSTWESMTGSFGCGGERGQSAAWTSCDEERAKRPELFEVDGRPILPEHETHAQAIEQRAALRAAPFKRAQAEEVVAFVDDMIRHWRAELKDQLGTEDFHRIHVINLHAPAVDHYVASERIVGDLKGFIGRGCPIAVRSVDHPEAAKVIDGIVQGHAYPVVDILRYPETVRFKLANHEAVSAGTHKEISVGYPVVRNADESGFTVNQSVFFCTHCCDVHFDVVLRCALMLLEINTDELSKSFDLILIHEQDRTSETDDWSWWVPNVHGPLLRSYHSSSEVVP